MKPEQTTINFESMENAANDGTYQNIILCMTIQYQIHSSYTLGHVIQRFVFHDNLFHSKMFNYFNLQV